MKTRKFSLAKIATVALVLLLTFAMAIPAFASSDPYQNGPFNVTINPDASTDISLAGRFTAYQIFKGDIDNTYKGGTTPGIFNPSEETLFNIEWGDGINVVDFVTSLKADTTVELEDGNNKIQIKEAIEKFLPGFNTLATDKYKNTSVARAIAKMLDYYSSNSLLVQTFARLADNALAGAGKTSTWKEDSKQWNIELDSAGYYLIVDNFKTTDSEKTPTDTVSAFILGVFGNSAVNMKSTFPTPDKNIGNSDAEGGGNSEGSAFEVGQQIRFELTGTLPENYAEYDTYYYAFHDTLSKGLTYLSTPTPTVSIITGTTETTLDAAEGDYDLTPGAVVAGEPTTVDIVINDLKAVAARNHITVDYTSKIKVTYYAEINDASVVYGGNGNPNEVYLEFDNNPHDESRGRSEKIEVYVYAFGLDVEKLSDDVDAKGEPNKLKDATFEIYDGDPNAEGSTAKKAYFSEKEDAGVRNYTLEGWLASGEEVPEGMTTSVLTDVEGRLNVRGLGSNTYYIKETVAPKGYNLLKNPIIVTIHTEIDSSTGKMTSFTVTVTNKNAVQEGEDATTTTTYAPDVSGGAEFNAGIFNSGLIPMDVVNYRAPLLPGTGGIGLVIFYVVGGLLLAGAAVYIVINGKKKKEEQ